MLWLVEGQPGFGGGQFMSLILALRLLQAMKIPLGQIMVHGWLGASQFLREGLCLSL